LAFEFVVSSNTLVVLGHPASFALLGKKLPAGHDDGGNWDGVAIRALLLNVLVLKQLAILSAGVPE